MESDDSSENVFDCGETKIKEKGNAEREFILVEEWIPDPHFELFWTAKYIKDGRPPSLFILYRLLR